MAVSRYRVQGLTEQQTYAARAAQLLGTSVDQIKDHLQHWMGDALTAYGSPQFDGSGAITYAADLGAGGWKRHSTGTTNPTLAYISGSAKPLPRMDTGKGYIRRRVKWETAYDANDVALYGLQNEAANATVGVGFIGSLDTVNLILQYDGNIAGSHLDLIALDTAIHVVEVWYVGDGKLHVAVDGTEVGTGVTLASPMTSVLHTLDWCTNGATGASDRRMADDFVYVATV
jgi:hypothetical protein